jgi:hypothetical protein
VSWRLDYVYLFEILLVDYRTKNRGPIPQVETAEEAELETDFAFAFASAFSQ